MADNGHAPDGICIAFGANWNDTSLTWTRLDDPAVAVFGYRVASPHNCNVVSNWTTNRGRSYELDKTQTGTASITLQDPNALFDPTNTSSPFYGEIRPMLPVSISLFNPANSAYTVVFTGWVESWEWTITSDERLEIVNLNMVDGFEPLSRAELVPDTTGAIYANAGNGTTVVVGDTAGTACNTRINGLLDTAQWPTGDRWRNINSGNIFLQGVAYNAGTSILSAIQDCADAEFPGISNVFIAKTGALTFFGRYPRFQPTNYPQDVAIWQVGDAQSANTIGAARIAVIEWNIDTSHIYNACLCYPVGIAPADMEAQLVTDTGTSVATYGYRALTLQDLLVFGQPAGSGASAQTPQPFTQTGANAVCVYYSQYYVDNYALPQLRISHLEFHSRLPGDSQTWQFLCGVEIGDIVSVYTHAPGAGGFGQNAPSDPDEFFVEGIHYTVQPLRNSSIVDVTMSLDVSPTAYFETAPWQ